MTLALFVFSLVCLHVALLGAGYCAGRLYSAARSPERYATRVDMPHVTVAAATHCALVACDDGPTWVELGGQLIHLPTFRGEKCR